MPALSMVFGILMVALGVFGYVVSKGASLTALFPCLWGAILIVAGLLAKREHLRKHVMHIAALVALLGIIGPLMNIFKAKELTLAVGCQIAFMLLCAIFLVLCVRSFINARVLKKAEPAPIEKQ